MSDINLLATTDAKVWAAEFMRMHGDKLPDEGLMIASFANMWAATYDPLQAEIERLEGALREIRQAAEDNNLTPDYIIALTMVADKEQT